MSFRSLMARLKRAESNTPGAGEKPPLDVGALHEFEAGRLAAEDLPPPWSEMLAAASAPPAECPLERLIRLAGLGLDDEAADDPLTPNPMH